MMYTSAGSLASTPVKMKRPKAERKSARECKLRFDKLLSCPNLSCRSRVKHALHLYLPGSLVLTFALKPSGPAVYSTVLYKP